VSVGDLIVAAGAVAVVLGGLLLGFATTPKGRTRNLVLTLGWVMVVFGLGAEGAAIVQSAHSSESAAEASGQ
jgi:hypothetical protein